RIAPPVDDLRDFARRPDVLGDGVIAGLPEQLEEPAGERPGADQLIRRRRERRERPGEAAKLPVPGERDARHLLLVGRLVGGEWETWHRLCTQTLAPVGIEIRAAVEVPTHRQREMRREVSAGVHPLNRLDADGERASDALDGDDFFFDGDWRHYTSRSGNRGSWGDSGKRKSNAWRERGQEELTVN